MNELPERLAAGIAPRLAMLRALADEEHVTRAAQRLGLPQPTVSRWLAELGERFDAALVVRHGRGVRLTRAGLALAESAEKAVAALEAGCRRALEEVDPERGQVVLGFLHLLGRTLVPELLRGFRAAHPGVRFGLVQSSRQEILDRLRSGEIDLAFVGPPPEEPDLRWAALREQELLLILPATHRLAHRHRVGIAELAEEPFVVHEPGFGLRQITEELFAAAGLTPRIAFEGQESDTLRGLVAAGLGVALLPTGDPAPTPGVVEIPVRPRAGRTIALVWPDGQLLAPAVRAFRDHSIEAHAGPADSPA